MQWFLEALEISRALHRELQRFVERQHQWPVGELIMICIHMVFTSRSTSTDLFPLLEIVRACANFSRFRMSVEYAPTDLLESGGARTAASF